MIIKYKKIYKKKSRVLNCMWSSYDIIHGWLLKLKRHSLSRSHYTNNPPTNLRYTIFGEVQQIMYNIAAAWWMLKPKIRKHSGAPDFKNKVHQIEVTASLLLYFCDDKNSNTKNSVFILLIPTLKSFIASVPLRKT